MSTFDPSYEPRQGSRNLTHCDADWSALRIVVAGLGISGFAAADALSERGAIVAAVSADATSDIIERARILEILDVDVRLGAEHLLDVPDGTELVVTSPGLRPDHPLLLAAAARGIPVWGEVELAWRMRAESGAAPWITITGTNGKTTTVKMLASILRAAGLRATSAGNVGTPLLEAVLHPEPYDVLAVELSSFQLHCPRSVRPVASVCLTLAPDHHDWHGALEPSTQAKPNAPRASASTRTTAGRNTANSAATMPCWPILARQHLASSRGGPSRDRHRNRSREATIRTRSTART